MDANEVMAKIRGEGTRVVDLRFVDMPGLWQHFTVSANEFSEDAVCRTVDVDSIREGWMIMDIGPETAVAFSAALSSAKKAVWNGPAGVFEWEAFSQGTRRIAAALADLGGATTIVGGGSTAEAVAKLGLAGRMSYVSTGGGASLDYLAGRTLPGVAALMDR